MFGKGDVLQDGMQGQGVILDARPGNILNRHGERNWHLRIRVHFEDGQTADTECEFFDLGISTVGPVSGLEPYPLAAGIVVPVRYDPRDRARVAVDRPKIIADTISAYEADRLKKIERAERQFAPSAGPSQRSTETDESYLADALAAAQTRGDAAEVQRLTKLLEDLISGLENK